MLLHQILALQLPPPANEVTPTTPTVTAATPSYVTGDGKNAISYVPEAKKETASNIKNQFYKMTSFVNNNEGNIAQMTITHTDAAGNKTSFISNEVENAKNVFLIDEGLQLGLADYDVVYQTSSGTLVEKFGKRIYNMPYSTISSRNAGYNTWVEAASGLNPESTSLEQLNKDGKVFTYNGKAFIAAQNGFIFNDSAQTGEFSYTVDFGKKVGSGTIKGIAFNGAKATDTIQLKETALASGFKSHNIDESTVPAKPANYQDPNVGFGGFGETSLPNSNKYYVELKGPNAEEVIGAVLKADEEYSVYSPTKDFNNVTEFNGRVGLAGCRDTSQSFCQSK